jgi:hypothetical protein
MSNGVERNKEMKKEGRKNVIKGEEERRREQRSKAGGKAFDTALYCSGLYNTENTVSSTHA